MPQTQVLDCVVAASFRYSDHGGVYSEGAWPIAIGKLLTMSERQLLDLDTVDSTCHGELVGNGFAFAAENATCTEDSHSYTGTQGYLRLDLHRGARSRKCHRIQGATVNSAIFRS